MEHSNNKQIRISAKNLGCLSLPDYCPKCFYLKLKLNFKLPFSIFPGIFSSIDSYSKKITHSHFQKKGNTPLWFRQFGNYLEPVQIPHHSKYFIIDRDTNIRLTGAPDEILKMRDGSYFILDYKTARFTNNQDELLPLYKVQLNAYALIGKSIGFNPVSGIGLIYYEPQTDIDIDNIDSVIFDNAFKMKFMAHMVELKLEPEKVILSLLKEVRRIGNSKVAPEGRRGCGDCERVGEIMEYLSRGKVR